MAESCFNLEKAKAVQLQENMDEDRNRYERRLNMIMSNPVVRSQGANTVDVASKIEIQNLRQELAAAQSSIVLSNQSTNAVTNAEEEQMVSKMQELEHENQEMKSNSAFDFWKDRWKKVRDERDEADRR